MGHLHIVTSFLKKKTHGTITDITFIIFVIQTLMFNSQRRAISSIFSIWYWSLSLEFKTEPWIFTRLSFTRILDCIFVKYFSIWNFQNIDNILKVMEFLKLYSQLMVFGPNLPYPHKPPLQDASKWK